MSVSYRTSNVHAYQYEYVSFVLVLVTRDDATRYDGVTTTNNNSCCIRSGHNTVFLP